MRRPLEKLVKSLRRTGLLVPVRPPLSRAGVKRILVVDDDQHSREGLRTSLLRTGAEVESAADAWEALRLIKVGQFDVAILDLDLPPVHGVEISGWDLVRILRAYSPSAAILLVSAESGEAARAEARQLGVAELLEKPINLAYLKAVIQSLIA
ncbi:response regulator [Nitrospira sp. Kam-Ns4a]